MSVAKLAWFALVAAYPLLVYFGLSVAEPRALGLLLLALALGRYLMQRTQAALGLAVAGFVLAMLALWSNDRMPLKLYPVVVNAGFLLLFGGSLLKGPPVVERIARWREPDLDARGVAYTRRVTQVWCGFFVLNGGLALATALWADEALWALYNGLIAYALMGALMAGEWCVRRKVRAAVQ